MALATALVPGATPDAGASHTDVGYLGPSFGGYSEERLPDDNPTAGTPQSKLWYNDGSWWGVLYGGPPPGAYRIHRLSSADQTWSNSGVLVDARFYSHADALWDGSHLYVATAAQPGRGNTDLKASLLRFSYNGGTYSLDAGFPIVLAQVEMEAIVLDKDSTGMLWATYTADNGQGGRSVYVTHSTGSDTSWRVPYVIPATGASNLTNDDVSAVIAYDGRIGVMWGNQTDSTIYFASHQDGTPDDQWGQNPAFQGPLLPEVHINLKASQGDSAGRVFAAVEKADKGISLLILDANGSWSSHDVYSETDNTLTTRQFRPIVIIDDGQRKLYVFTSSEIWEHLGDHNGTQISYKESSLDNISFAPGLGTTFIYNKFNTYGILNPTSKKGSVNGTAGLVVLAGDYQQGEYWHNTIGLVGPTPPTPTATSVPPTATGVPPTATPLPTSPPASGELLTNGSFENGSTGWTLSAQAQVSAAAAYEGSFGLRFSGKTTSAIARQDLAVTGGSTLTFRAAGRVVAANNSTEAGIVEFKVYDDAGAQLAYWKFDTIQGAPSDWRVITGTVTTPANTKKARVQVRVVNLDGTMDFDAFSLTAEGASALAAVPQAAVSSTESTASPAATDVPPEPEALPTETSVLPTAAPPAEAAMPPAETAVLPTSVPSEPTATTVPPADTAEPAAPTAAPEAEPSATPRGWGRGGRSG